MRASKRMSYLLRHHPEASNLTLDSSGWALIDELLQAVGIDRATFDAVVAQNDKNRFEVSEGRVRARQGHSVAVDLDLQPVIPPSMLYHGTTEEALPSIFATGLERRTRQHVHLSSTVEVALDVAGRRGRGQAVILEVDAEAFTESGGVVYRSSNGVYLTEAIPPEYLKVSNG